MSKKILIILNLLGFIVLGGVHAYAGGNPAGMTDARAQAVVEFLRQAEKTAML